MFAKTAVLATVTLSLLASTGANPVPVPAATPETAKRGVGVPITKRSGLTTNEGIFDSTKASAHIAKIKAKYRQNLLNLQRNTGSLPEGARILDESELSKRDGEPLTDQEEELWTGEITVGGQKFLADFDTGSSDLWIPSSKCTSSTCKSKNKYDASKSSTSSKKSGTFSIQYGDGSTVSGPIYTDDVSVAGVSVTKQYFSPVETLSSAFSGSPEDGILGLAFPAISNLGQNPFFNTAESQKTVSSNSFAFKLSSNGSELFLGGNNPDLYTGDIEYHSLASSQGFWQIGGASFLLNGSSQKSGFQTIIDSGTTLFYGPPSTVKTIFSKISGSKVYDSDEGLYSYPCSSKPQISLSWGGEEWAISDENWNLGQTEEGSSDCVASLGGLDLGLGTNVWLVGDAFMKNVYTVFDFDKKSVGFAKLA